MSSLSLSLTCPPSPLRRCGPGWWDVCQMATDNLFPCFRGGLRRGLFKSLFPPFHCPDFSLRAHAHTYTHTNVLRFKASSQSLAFCNTMEEGYGGEKWFLPHFLQFPFGKPCTRFPSHIGWSLNRSKPVKAWGYTATLGGGGEQPHLLSA